MTSLNPPPTSPVCADSSPTSRTRWSSRVSYAHLPPLDLLLLDLDLPDGNGLDLLDDPALPDHGRAIIVTGQPSVESAIQAVSKPVVDYLLKPLCPIEFDALLTQAAAAHARAAGDAGRYGMVGRCERDAAHLRRDRPRRADSEHRS